MAQCPFFYNITDRPNCPEDTTCYAWRDQSPDTSVATKLLTYSGTLDLNTISGINTAYTFITTSGSPLIINRMTFNLVIERIKTFEGYSNDISVCLTNFANYYNNVVGYCSLIESAIDNMSSPMAVLKGVTNELSSDATDIQDKIETESKEIRMRLVGLTGSEPYDEENDYNLRSNISVLPLLKYIRHIHNDHYHSVPHMVDEGLSNDQENMTNDYIQPIRNGCVFSPIISPPNILLQEFISNLDLDGNGMVYGTDFMIPNSDSQKPYILKTIEKMPEWTIPHPLVTMTYLEYLSSIGWTHDPSWIYDYE